MVVNLEDTPKRTKQTSIFKSRTRDPYLAATFDEHRATKVLFLRSNLSATDVLVSSGHQNPARQLPLSEEQQTAATHSPTTVLSIRAGAGSGSEIFF